MPILSLVKKGSSIEINSFATLTVILFSGLLVLPPTDSLKGQKKLKIKNYLRTTSWYILFIPLIRTRQILYPEAVKILG